MTTDVKPAPGHLGNLTRDQKYKLKEAYLAFYTAVGVVPNTIKVAGDPPTTEQKKSRLGFGSSKTVVEDSLDQATETLNRSFKGTDLKQVHALMQSMNRCDLPDQVMLRFLRARKWDVAKAVGMLADTLLWRLTEGHIDTLLARGEVYYINKQPDPPFINLFEKGLAVLKGHDKQGRPIVTINVRRHDPKAQSEAAVERYTLLLIETVRMCLHGNVETAAVIFDLGEFTLSNMDYAVVKFILRCFEAHYPESLGYLFIHRAPWVFGGVWNIIKPLIDPVVASKISFTRSEKDLLKYIDSDQIPTELGGTSKVKYEWIPPADGADALMDDTDTRNKLTAERESIFHKFDELTLEWIQNDGAQSDALADKREKVSQELQDQYWRIDPYIRSRLIGDRNGTVEEFRKLHE